jgi:hypothetical protein
MEVFEDCVTTGSNNNMEVAEIEPGLFSAGKCNAKGSLIKKEVGHEV